MSRNAERSTTAVMQQFEDLLEIVSRASDVLGKVGNALQALAADEQTRADVLPWGRENAATCLQNALEAASNAGKIKDVLRFFASPSARTLGTALQGGTLSADEIDEQVWGVRRSLETRDWSTDTQADAEVADMLKNPQVRARSIAAVHYEDLNYTPSKIAKFHNTSRAKVYEAIEWFRGLPEDVQMAIRKKVLDVGLSARGKQKRRTVIVAAK